MMIRKMKMQLLFGLLSCATTAVIAQSGATSKITYVDEFKNVNHPEIGYWFITPSSLANEHYLEQLDTIIRFSKFDLIFLSARNGTNFYDTKKMYPVFKAITEKAHQHNVKIGLQFFEDSKTPVAIENTERYITETEITLDNQGKGSAIGSSKHVRAENLLIKSELLKAFAFKKTSDGFYQPGSLKDITAQCKSEYPEKSKVSVIIEAGEALKGYTVYLTFQHFYNFSTNFGNDASLRFTNTFEAYKNIPFDGMCLDEYANMRPVSAGDLEKKKEVFRERLYSLPLAKLYKENTGTALERALLDMRYAPEGNDVVRIKAINCYMDFMRTGPMYVENKVYAKTKELFGKDAFIAAHDTYHNKLTTDEIWTTGINWWNIPREYGQTDELTPFPTQMGIAMNYSQNVLYNMYYHKDINKLAEKALTDLRYGIRTHYHAFNDIRWGISLEKQEALEAINKVENCARLLNRFNPSLPETKLLVVFGIEAIANWYPNSAVRGIYDINDKLAIEEKAVALWNAGYTNALIPTDLIEQKRVKVLADGKVDFNGHVFDAVVFLNPQYVKESTLQLLETIVKNKGKLLVAGEASKDFVGNDITQRMAVIAKQAVATTFSIDNVAKLGIAKTTIVSGCKNADGSYIFTDYNSLQNKSSSMFNFQQNGNTYTGTYRGMVAIRLNVAGTQIDQLAATGLTEISKNGKAILTLDKPADILVNRKLKTIAIELADKQHSINILNNKL